MKKIFGIIAVLASVIAALAWYFVSKKGYSLEASYKKEA